LSGDANVEPLSSYCTASATNARAAMAAIIASVAALT
jgi:hypothetical protein